jgi:mannose-1-phosphate guanylyltransferase/mannose-6-phosphate isomerase
MTTIVPLILCGGAGKRLWPLSRGNSPKQFCPLFDGLSLFQKTAMRCSGKNFALPVIITSAEFRFLVAQQLSEINIKPDEILIEPEPKNTAPAILAGVSLIQQKRGNVFTLILPSDHHVTATDEFQHTIVDAANSMKSNQIMTFGAQPKYAATGFGYIRSRENNTVIEFVEKPSETRAKKFLKEGNYLWNSGMFLTKCKTIVAAGHNFAHKTQKLVESSLKDSIRDLDFLRLDPEFWTCITPDSVDYAIMEKAKNISVTKLNFEWRDLGDWLTLADELVVPNNNRDTNGNLTLGKVEQLETSNSTILSLSDQQVVASVGLTNTVVVALPDAVLVASKSEVQKVKDLVESMALRSWKQAISHGTEFRPWGSFTNLFESADCKVKKLSVFPNSHLSLQSHKFRSEHWVVISGIATVQIDDKVFELTVGQSTFIRAGQKHRLANVNCDELSVIEVQTGTYFGEDDIIRYEDDYNRQDLDKTLS